MEYFTNVFIYLIWHTSGQFLWWRRTLALWQLLTLKTNCLLKSRKFDEQANLYSIEVVHSQNGATLIFITQEAKSFGFSSFLVSDKIYIHYLAIPVGIKKAITFDFSLERCWSLEINRADEDYMAMLRVLPKDFT